MEPEKEVKLLDAVREFNRLEIRYLIIGRRAVVFFRVPSIEDLIRLKKIRKPNVKDEQDIEYLLQAKQLRKKS